MTYESDVWSWSEHLRAGGVTPWRDWPRGSAGATGLPPPGWSPPGAAQLELVRRAAATHVATREALAAFADLVTSRSAPGRGLAPQPLSWLDDADVLAPTGTPSGHRLAHRFGAPPVDPSEVPVGELVRVGVGALTELLLSATGSARSASRRPGLRREALRRTPAFVLAGAPVTTSVVRRALGRAGHAEGGGSPRVVLLAEPFDHALAQAWSARVQRGAPVRWHGFVERWSRRRDLPPSVDLPALARRWADRVGVGQVHVVATASDAAETARLTADVLGIDIGPGDRRQRSLPSPSSPSRRRPDGWSEECLELSPAAVDLARRVNAVLTVRVPEQRHAAALRQLVQDLAPSAPVGHALTVPELWRDWARDRARQLVGDLDAGGYPVHGQLDRLVPRFDGLPTHPSRTEVLELVVAACLGRPQRSARVSVASEPKEQ